MARIFTALQNTTGGGYQGVAQGFQAGQALKIQKDKLKEDSQYRKDAMAFAETRAGVEDTFKTTEQTLKRDEFELRKTLGLGGERRADVTLGREGEALAFNMNLQGRELELAAEKVGITRRRGELDHVLAVRSQTEVERLNLAREQLAKSAQAEEFRQFRETQAFTKEKWESEFAFSLRQQEEFEKSSGLAHQLSRDQLSERKEARLAVDALGQARQSLAEELGREQAELSKRAAALADKRQAYTEKSTDAEFAESVAGRKAAQELATEEQAMDKAAQAFLEKRTIAQDKQAAESQAVTDKYKGALTGYSEAQTAVLNRETRGMEQQAASAADVFGNTPTNEADDVPVDTPVPRLIKNAAGDDVRVIDDPATGLIIEIDHDGTPVVDPGTGMPKVVEPQEPAAVPFGGGFSGVGMPPMSGYPQGQEPTSTKPSSTLAQIRAIDPDRALAWEAEYKNYARILQDPGSSGLDRDGAMWNIARMGTAATEFLQGDAAVGWREDQMRAEVAGWWKEDGLVGAESNRMAEEGKSKHGKELLAWHRGQKRRHLDSNYFTLTTQVVRANAQERLANIDATAANKDTLNAITAKVRDGIPPLITDRHGADKWAEEIDILLDVEERSETTKAAFVDQQKDFEDLMARRDRAVNEQMDLAKRIADQDNDFNIHDALIESPLKAIPLIADNRKRKTAEVNVRSIEKLLGDLFEREILQEPPTEETVKAVLALMQEDMDPQVGGGVGVAPLITPSGRAAKVGPDGMPIKEVSTSMLMTDDFGGMLAEFIPRLLESEGFTRDPWWQDTGGHFRRSPIRQGMHSGAEMGQIR